MKPTIKDVAELAGVSTATVSRVLNEPGTVSDKLTDKVKEAVRELNYRPNSMAKGLRTNKTHTIALLITDNESPFYARLVRGVEDTALENHYSLMVCNTDEELEKERLYLDTLVQRSIDGLIVSPTGRYNDKLDEIKSDGIPFVFIDRKLERIETDVVLTENLKGSYGATKHLITRNHERIGVISGVKNVTTNKERLQGYKKALREFRIDVKEELIVEGSYTTEGGEEATKSLLSLKNRPSAIFSFNGKMMMGALKTLRRKGFSYPEDISLVSFDDFDVFSVINPPLTAVKQSTYEMGVRAFNLLLGKINGDRKRNSQEIVRVPAELVVRGSTATL